MFRLWADREEKVMKVRCVKADMKTKQTSIHSFSVVPDLIMDTDDLTLSDLGQAT